MVPDVKDRPVTHTEHCKPSQDTLPRHVSENSEIENAVSLAVFEGQGEALDDLFDGTLDEGTVCDLTGVRLS